MNEPIVIPEECPPKRKSFLEYIPILDWFNQKDEYNKAGMFAYVAWSWIEPLAKWINGRKCLEVMAGAGYLAMALRSKGVYMIASDDNSWQKANDWKNVTDILEMDCAEAAINFGKHADILIVSWPYMDSNGFRAIQAYHTVNPDGLIIYIGEWGGCTGDDELHSHLEEVKDPEFDKITQLYRSWPAIHDGIYLCKFKTNKQC